MNKTKEKLRQARFFFSRMKEAHSKPEKFAYNLESFLSFAHEVTLVMQKEFCKKANFKKWFNREQREMQADEMLRFFDRIEKVRIREIGTHKKSSNKECIAYIREFYILFPPRDGWRFFLTKKGEAIWISPKGFEFDASKFSKKFRRVYIFEDAPRTFLGHDLMDYSVLYLCDLYLGFLTALVKKAIDKFVYVEYGENRNAEI